ncbi:hypothetical protein SELMODRAFT_431208 [Selaginella moellendorffii]|uniref:Uncharacterized protein n=1 Tax=Selaginella moellendorffii TaxID=88036 RepID=D8TBV6_SELML|nr:hypothetical protein SELMODRAFT_431208 [Selaginella moellendorffii]
MAALFCFAALFLMTSLSPLQVSCSDRDPLHDFCVADLYCPLLNNNDYSCKPYPNVTIDDFVFSGLLTPLDPSQSTSGAIATPGDVNTGIADEVLEKTFRLEAETVDRLVKFFTPIAQVVKGN